MTNFILNRPILIVLTMLALTIFLGLGLRHGLRLNVSPLLFIAEESAEREDFHRARAQFGDDLVLVVAVESDDALAPANLAKLRALHEQIEKLSGVAEIISLSNAPFAYGEASGVRVEKLIPALPELTPARLALARSVALQDKLFAGQIVARDGRTAALNILFKPELTTEERYALTAQIADLANRAGFVRVFLAGDPYSQWQSVTALQHDLRLFLPLTLLLIAVLLWLCFRSLVAVVLPLLTVGMGLLWVFGLMGHLGVSFTILNLMLPTLLLAIGCSYVMHVFNQIGLEQASQSQTQSQISTLQRALNFISLPVIVSALTIIAGFLSLAFTKIPNIRTTAIFAAVGAGVTMLLSLTFVPAVLCLLSEKAAHLHVGLGGRMIAGLEKTGRLAVSRESLLYVLTGALCVLSVVGIFRLDINVDYYGFFKPHSEVARNLSEVGHRLAGAIGFDIIIEANQDGALEAPAVLGRIAELATFAETASQGQALSVVDFIKHGNRAFHNNDPQFAALPNEEKIIHELLADREQLRKFITDDSRQTRILVRSPLSGSAAMSRAIHAIEAKGRELLPEFRIYATGTIALMNRTSDNIAREQLQSVTIALLTIYVMLSLLFKSWRVGITALVPNLLPVLFFFGYMGWSGTPLNMTTSLVASVVLGLAVDNAVQFIVRFRRVQPHFASVREAIIESLRLSGRPIIYANIAIAAAFAVFALSNFWPVSTFGILSAITILGCLVEDLVLLPARLTSPIFRATTKAKEEQ
ncbi:MAG: MMPL family transporter [Blastocatellia bacterium]